MQPCFRLLRAAKYVTVLRNYPDGTHLCLYEKLHSTPLLQNAILYDASFTCFTTAGDPSSQQLFRRRKSHFVFPLLRYEI